MNNDKHDAILQCGTQIAEALESGAPHTDTVQSSLVAFAAMVAPHDEALAARILVFA